MYLHSNGKELFCQTLPLLSTLQHHHCVCVCVCVGREGGGGPTLKYIVGTLQNNSTVPIGYILLTNAYSLLPVSAVCVQLLCNSHTKCTLH